MRTQILTTVLILSLAACPAGPDPSPPPRLIVVISVDQMRADFLDRYASTYTGGLARFREQGVVFEDAHQDHAATETAVGHAAIGTGTYPRTHGIVGNNFYDRGEGRVVYSMEDSTALLVGRPSGDPAPARSGRSPRRLAHSTLGDWVKRDRPGARVFGVSIKDRAGPLMAGPRADGAYWYDNGSGRMITSTFYRDALPDWVERFNAAGHFAAFRDSAWHRLLPVEAYDVSRSDDHPAEGSGRQTTFPHPLPDDAGFYDRIITSGYSDPIVLEFARQLLDAEGLGDDDTPDLLFLGASAADYVGHAFGPWSHEAQDYYLRLDRALGTLFAELDARVGRGAWAAVLTADHGVLPLPEHLVDQGVNAVRVPGRESNAQFQRAIELTRIDLPYDIDISYAGGVILRYDSSVVSHAQVAEFREAFAIRLRDLDLVADAYTWENLESTLDVPYVELFRQQHFSGRGPDIRLRFRENYLVGAGRTGTSHGSPYAYDTHVPLVFLREGLTPDRIDRRVRTIDIAPTLAAWLGIDVPATVEGEVLEEVTGES